MTVEFRIPGPSAYKPSWLSIAAQAHSGDLGASGVCLTGSVARGEDHDDSDIDFWLQEFDGDEMTTSRRATQLVKAFREILTPYSVDIRADYFPGWPVDDAQAQSMRRDAISIDDL